MAHDDALGLRLEQPELFAGPAPEDWIASDVAVDFPSMRPVIERMLRSFVAADLATACLSARLQLTRREAACGRRMPLTLLVRRTCARCGGRGEQWGEPCAGCTGTGEALVRHQVRVHVPSGVRHGARYGFRVALAQGPPTFVNLQVSIDGDG